MGGGIRLEKQLERLARVAVVKRNDNDFDQNGFNNPLERKTKEAKKHVRKDMTVEKTNLFLNRQI